MIDKRFFKICFIWKDLKIEKVPLYNQILSLEDMTTPLLLVKKNSRNVKKDINKKIKL